MKAKSDVIDSISDTLKNIRFSFILKHQDIQHIPDLFQEVNSVILSYNEGGKEDTSNSIAHKQTRTGWENYPKTMFRKNIFYMVPGFLNGILSFSLLFAVILIISGCGWQIKSAGPKYGDSPASEIPIYHFAVHPLHNPSKLIESYQPLIDYINGKLMGPNSSLRHQGITQILRKNTRTESLRFSCRTHGRHSRQ